MSRVAASLPADGGTGSEPAAAGDFAELRTLIIGPEQRQLHALQARLDDPGRHARDISEVLPEAVRLRKHDPHLTRALAPTIEEAITASVQKNPRPLADALFPVIGPAIRKAIAASLSGMLESLNRTVEHSLSWRAISWRITALTTGKSFAEVVLLNTLLYRVEQVLLIDRRSGLLLQHVTSDPKAVQDPDMVSGMLTAIQDFSRDSFRVSDDDSLEALRIGDLSVWIEPGPHAILAAVIRGTPPRELRTALQEAIERIHAFYGDALRSFDGDAGAFEDLRPTLEDCLQSQYRPGSRRPSRALWALASILAVALMAWLYLTLQSRARWNGYLDALRAEPGIVVVAEERRGGRYVVRGLRDPAARDPASMLPAYHLAAGSVSGRWQLYQALDPSLVLARARQVLRPPSTVGLHYADGVLTASGEAPVEWIMESARMAPALPGVSRYDEGAAIDTRVRQITGALEASPVLFVKGSTALVPDGDRRLATARELVRALDELTRLQGSRLTIEIKGHADSDGPQESNTPLSVRRAAHVRDVLLAAGLRSVVLIATGVGSTEPLGAGATESDKQRNRRVSLRVVPAVPNGDHER